ncbi:hypothetical protein [Rhodococcus sp. NPDC055024]
MTTPTLRDRVLGEIPNYTDTKATLDRISVWLNELHNVTPVSKMDLERTMSEEVKRAALYGEERPTGFAHRLTENFTAIEDKNADVRLFTTVRTDLRAELDALSDRGLGYAFPRLRSELDDVLGEVRDIAPALEGVTGAEDAMRSGVADQWLALDSLITRYDEIRDVHWHLVEVGYRPLLYAANPEAWLESGQTTDHIETEPIWLYRRRNALRLEQIGGADTLISDHVAWIKSTPRPAERAQGEAPLSIWPETVTKQQHLVSLAVGGKVWLPDAETIVAVYSSATQATATFDDLGSATGAAKARQRHADLIAAAR